MPVWTPEEIADFNAKWADFRSKMRALEEHVDAQLAANAVKDAGAFGLQIPQPLIDAVRTAKEVADLASMVPAPHPAIADLIRYVRLIATVVGL